MLTYASVCSGIEAPSVAWSALGWRPLWFAEIEPFPSAVLAHHHPDVPNYGDFTRLLREPPATPDVLVGGTPCQAFSVAGLRGGLADPRGNLALAFVALVGVLRPRWVLWENVPGVLSSGGGRDFGSFLGGLAELGYGFAYRVLDAQYFGLAQRRERVFVVASPGDWTGPAQILLEPEGVRRDPPSRGEAGAGVAGALAARLGGCGADDNAGQAGHVLPVGLRDSDGATARSLNAHPTRMDLDTETFIAHTLRGTGHDASEDGTGRGVPLIPVVSSGRGEVRGVWTHGDPIVFNNRGREGGAQVEVDPTGLVNLRAAGGGSSRSMVAYQCHGSNVGEMGTLRKGNGSLTGGVPFVAVDAPRAVDWMNSAGAPNSPGTFGTLCKGRAMGVQESMGVRRLTPREMERLQGFHDDYTAIPWRGKPASECPDGPRAKALGNSMATPVVRWIGARIELVTTLRSPT